MCKEITAYEAIDGSIHLHKLEALREDLFCTFVQGDLLPEGSARNLVARLISSEKYRSALLETLRDVEEEDKKIPRQATTTGDTDAL